MSNYSIYEKKGGIDSLLNMIKQDVKKEWLNESQFEIALDESVSFLLEVSKSNKNKLFIPDPKYVLEPFKYMKPSEIKAVIIAQDPYPRKEDAWGIAFHSLNERCPLSAKNINENLYIHGHIPTNKWNKYMYSADYRPLLKQGVLMTNITLTTIDETKEECPHFLIWEGVIKEAFRLISKQSVAILLGQYAQDLSSEIPSIGKISHYHPAARGPQHQKFLDRDIFGEANNLLSNWDIKPIDWKPAPRY